jgi:hypothetical protein
MNPHSGKKDDNKDDDDNKKDRTKTRARAAAFPIVGAILSAAILLSGLSSFIGSYSHPVLAQMDTTTGGGGGGTTGGATNATMAGGGGNMTNATMAGGGGNMTNATMAGGGGNMTNATMAGGGGNMTNATMAGGGGGGATNNKTEAQQAFDRVIQSLQALDTAYISGNKAEAQAKLDQAQADWNTVAPVISSREASEIQLLFSSLGDQLKSDAPASKVGNTVNGMISELREDIQSELGK